MTGRRAGAALVAAASLVVAYYVPAALVRRTLIRRLRAPARPGAPAALTFDDGPDPVATPRILELLERAGVRATFFVLGRNAARHPELVRRIAAAGHELGGHSHAHHHAWRTPPLRTVLDVVRGERSVTRAAPETPRRLFRPPHGKVNTAMLMCLALMRRRMAFWTVDSRDFSSGDPSEVADRVLRDLRPGSVVLLHDGRINGADPGVTATALEAILAGAAARSIRLAPAGELL